MARSASPEPASFGWCASDGLYCALHDKHGGRALL